MPVIRIESDGWWRDEYGECYGKDNYELLCTIIREFDFSSSPSGELEAIIACIDAKTSIHIDTEHGGEYGQHLAGTCDRGEVIMRHHVATRHEDRRLCVLTGAQVSSIDRLGAKLLGLCDTGIAKVKSKQFVYLIARNGKIDFKAKAVDRKRGVRYSGCLS